MKSNKSILLLGAGEMQIPLIKCAKQLGLRTVVCDYDRNAPGLGFADVASITSTLDTAAVLEIAKRESVHGIATSSDYPVRVVAEVGRTLGLKVLPQDSAEICTDKYMQRKIFKSNGLLTPSFKLIKSKEDLQEIEKQIEFPLIVKPVDSSASRGVSKVKGKEILTEAYEFARKYSRNGMVIVEEFIDGREFSVEVLIQNKNIRIIAITEKTTSGDGDNYFVEERHVIPANISENERVGINEVVTKGIRSVGLDHCASHTEVKLSKKGPVIIEMAARLGGDYITSDLVPLATGVDMLQNVINIAIGIDFKPEHLINKVSGIQFVTPENYERAKSHFQKIKNDTRVKTLFIKNKEAVNLKLRSSLDRLGHVIAYSTSKESLLEILNF